MSSKCCNYIYFPLLFKDLDANIIGLTLKEKIYRGGADAQSSDRKLWNAFRQARALKYDAVAGAINP